MFIILITDNTEGFQPHAPDLALREVTQAQEVTWWFLQPGFRWQLISLPGELRVDFSTALLSWSVHVILLLELLLFLLTSSIIRNNALPC